MYVLADITVTAFPPSDALPSGVAELIAARDAAYDALSDFEDANADYLSDDWESIFESRDIQAAIDAVNAGKSTDKLRSSLAEARDRRPTILGAHRALMARLRKAESAAKRAFRPVAGTLEPQATARLRETAQRAEDAYRAYLTALAEFGASASVVRFVRGWQNGDQPDYVDTPQAPLRADHFRPEATEPLAQIREVVRSFDKPFVADPLIWVEFGDGQRMELKRSQAVALAGSINNDVRLVGEEA